MTFFFLSITTSLDIIGILSSFTFLDTMLQITKVICSVIKFSISSSVISKSLTHSL